MERTGISFLLNWLKSSNRLPLVIRGARQVGKTWIVRHLAQLEKLRLIELNFEDQKELASTFSSNDPTIIVKNLEDILGIEKIEPRKSLLFLDEIQAVPELYPKLRWFAEKMPELPVIAAGSLFEFIFKQDHEPLSMPVGRVEFMYLEPLSFEEFLLAKEKKQLVRLINSYTWSQDIPTITHTTLLSYFKEYIIVGGMPAAVKKWVIEQNLVEVSRIHHNILATFKGDFHKFAGRMDSDLLEQTMERVPVELGKKFVYSTVSKDVQVPAIKKSLDLLCKARLCHKIFSTAANGLPLHGEVNEKFIKAIFLDVGLCSASLGLSLVGIKSVQEIALINSGGIAEQVVGQLLRSMQPLFIDPELYYWLRYEKKSTAEIDYIIQHEAHVLPIEVKAGEAGTLKSLHFFMGLKKLSSAVRVYSGMPLRTPIKTKDPYEKSVSYELMSIPFYLISQMNRLVNE
ncbi:ATP-binding protein [Candidatus Dependentiae bacterium]|nr:ATP-binding protein [Candidatus Dependentiae bacterium]